MKQKRASGRGFGELRVKTIVILSPPTLDNILGGEPNLCNGSPFEETNYMNKTLTFHCCMRRSIY